MAVSTNEKKCKTRSKGVMWGSRDPLLEFWDPLIYPVRLKVTWGSRDQLFWNFGTPNISGTNEARNFKFGTEMDRQQ